MVIRRWVLRGVHTWLTCLHPWSLSPGGGLEGSGFSAIFPSPLSRLLTFPFILVCVRCPSSTCRVNLFKTDTCPISPYPKSLGVVVKAEEYGSVRCRALNGSEGSFPWIFLDFLSSLVLYRFCPSFRWDFGSVEN